MCTSRGEKVLASKLTRVIATPTERRAVGAQGAGMTRARGHGGDETPDSDDRYRAGWGDRRPIAELTIGIRSPAHERAVRPQRATVLQADRERHGIDQTAHRHRRTEGRRR